MKLSKAYSPSNAFWLVIYSTGNKDEIEIAEIFTCKRLAQEYLEQKDLVKPQIIKVPFKKVLKQ